MPQDCLYRFAVNSEGVKIRCKATPEGVPAVPLGERLIALEIVSLWFMLILLLLADHTRRKRGDNYAASEIVQIQRLAISRLKDRQAWLCQDASAQLVRGESVGQLFHYRNRRTAATCLRF